MEEKLNSGNVTSKQPVKFITYREERFETREVDCGKYGFVTVAKSNLWEALREGIQNVDYTASEVDDEIAYYCTEDEFKLSDQELCRLIYD